jgi:hypothetical protein
LARVFAARFLQTPPGSDALALRDYITSIKLVKRTFTAKLSNMHGVKWENATAVPVRSWLRAVDLNHRPLGYEFKGKLIPNNLQAHG